MCSHSNTSPIYKKQKSVVRLPQPRNNILLGRNRRILVLTASRQTVNRRALIGITEIRNGLPARRGELAWLEELWRGRDDAVEGTPQEVVGPPCEEVAYVYDDRAGDWSGGVEVARVWVLDFEAANVILEHERQGAII